MVRRKKQDSEVLSLPTQKQQQISKEQRDQRDREKLRVVLGHADLGTFNVESGRVQDCVRVKGSTVLGAIETALPDRFIDELVVIMNANREQLCALTSTSPQTKTRIS